MKGAEMNRNRYLISAGAAAVFFFFYGFVMNTIVLNSFYRENISPQMFRPEGTELIWVIALSCIFQALILGYIFLKNYEGKGWIEGARFGFWIALFFCSAQLITYAVMPLSFNVAIIGTIADGLGYVGLGAVFALVYRP
jgi:hypothetical protein